MDDDDVVLSEVHVGEHYDDHESSIGRMLIPSRYYFTTPPTHSVDNVKQHEVMCSEEADDKGDDDDDEVVPRKRLKHGGGDCSKGTAITIVHSLATPLGLVGLQVWSAAFLLGDFLLNNSERFQDCVAIELGAGPGLPGIIMGQWAKCCFLTDYHPQIIQLLERNVNANAHLLRSPLNMHVRKLDWLAALKEQEDGELSQVTDHNVKDRVEVEVEGEDRTTTKECNSGGPSFFSLLLQDHHGEGLCSGDDAKLDNRGGGTGRDGGDNHPPLDGRAEQLKLKAGNRTFAHKDVRKKENMKDLGDDAHENDGDDEGTFDENGVDDSGDDSNNDDGDDDDDDGDDDESSRNGLMGTNAKDSFAWREEDGPCLRSLEVLLASDVVYEDKQVHGFFRQLMTLMPPLSQSRKEQVLYLALEKRFNFTLAKLSVVATGYRTFLDYLDVEIGNGLEVEVAVEAEVEVDDVYGNKEKKPARQKGENDHSILDNTDNSGGGRNSGASRTNYSSHGNNDDDARDRLDYNGRNNGDAGHSGGGGSVHGSDGGNAHGKGRPGAVDTAAVRLFTGRRLPLDFAQCFDCYERGQHMELWEIKRRVATKSSYTENKPKSLQGK